MIWIGIAIGATAAHVIHTLRNKAKNRAIKKELQELKVI